MTSRTVGAVVALACVAIALAQTVTSVVVAPGDTLSSIARAHGVTVDDLIEVNGLNGDLIVVGQRLEIRGPTPWRSIVADAEATWERIAAEVDQPIDRLRSANPDLASPGGRVVRVPPDTGTLATPLLGDDLLSFAARHGTSPGTIVALNGLVPPYRLDPAVPWVVDDRDHDAAPSSDAGARHERLRWDALTALARRLEGVRLQPPEVDTFVWPLPRPVRLTSSFGWRNVSVAGNRYHLGIDLAAPSGTPVVAARAGRVVGAGWMGSYGYAVIVDHGGGIETRYAHLSALEVTVGAPVAAGESVGRVGSTGASTGPHLHFEVRRMGSALDPLTVLPPTSEAATGR